MRFIFQVFSQFPVPLCLGTYEEFKQKVSQSSEEHAAEALTSLLLVRKLAHKKDRDFVF